MKKITKYFKFFLLIILFLTLNKIYAIDSTWFEIPEIKIGSYIDIFYATDFANFNSEKRQNFLYNYNRNNAININLAMLKLKIENTKYRIKFAVQTGTYVKDVYENEDIEVRNIHEANIGVSLLKNNKLWLDIGIMPSHIGCESILLFENFTATPTILSDLTPYFDAGAKLTYKPNDNWELNSLILNGWQRIAKVKGNSIMSYGTQIIFKQPSYFINWSTFIGTDDPDSIRRMRYFSNLFFTKSIGNKFNFTAVFDYGIQSKNKDSNGYYSWYGMAFIGQFIVKNNFNLGFKTEFYTDKNGVIYVPKKFDIPIKNGFTIGGLSINSDIWLNKNIIIRNEVKLFNSNENIFKKDNFYENYDVIWLSTITARF